MQMKKLRCDKPYDIDEARKKRELPRRRRKDSRTTAYELIIRVPDEYRVYFDGKKKLTRTVFALNRKDDLKSQVEAFEDEKNAELERQAAWKENRKAARWAKKHGTLAKPFKPVRVAGSDMQSKVLKFLREVMNYALEKEDIPKNVAKAKFLTRVFKKSKPIIDPLMADDAARFLQEVERLPLCYLKVTLPLLLNTGMRPEEMLAIRAGNIVFDGNETIISITGALDRDGKTVKDHPKSDAGRRSAPVDDYTADTARAWIELKSEMAREQGLKPSMSMLVCGPEMIPRTYQSWYRDWLRFVADAGFEGVRPYALRHTFATLNLANGESIKTVAVLMGHASSAYTLDLFAAYVPNTGRNRQALHELPSSRRLGVAREDSLK